ncbi:MAG: DUF4199 domain-containing protein [Pseudomonadales bacterium]
MQTEIKWGLIIVAAGFVWILAEWLAGLHGPNIAWHGTITMFWIPLAMVLLVLGLREKKRVLGGHLSYGRGVLAGVVIAVIIALLSPVTQWLYLAVINPGFFGAMIDYAVATGTDRATAESYFTLSNYLIEGTVGAFVGTVVTTLIAMIFLRGKA